MFVICTCALKFVKTSSLYVFGSFLNFIPNPLLFSKSRCLHIGGEIWLKSFYLSIFSVYICHLAFKDFLFLCGLALLFLQYTKKISTLIHWITRFSWKISRNDFWTSSSSPVWQTGILAVFVCVTVVRFSPSFCLSGISQTW